MIINNFCCLKWRKTEQRRFKTNDTTKKGVITSSVSMFFPLSIENEINLEEKLQL